MDLILVMKERLRDQNSEIRSLTRTFLHLTGAAILLLVVSLYENPLHHPDAVQAQHMTTTSYIFLLSTAVAFMLMSVALHLLKTNRFVVVPYQATSLRTGGSAATVPVACHQWLYPYVYFGLMGVQFAIVFLALPFAWYLLMLVCHLVVYFHYAYLLWLSMTR